MRFATIAALFGALLITASSAHADADLEKKCRTKTYSFFFEMNTPIDVSAVDHLAMCLKVADKLNAEWAATQVAIEPEVRQRTEVDEQSLLKPVYVLWYDRDSVAESFYATTEKLLREDRVNQRGHAREPLYYVVIRENSPHYDLATRAYEEMRRLSSNSPTLPSSPALAQLAAEVISPAKALQARWAVYDKR